MTSAKRPISVLASLFVMLALVLGLSACGGSTSGSADGTEQAKQPESSDQKNDDSDLVIAAISEVVEAIKNPTEDGLISLLGEDSIEELKNADIDPCEFYGRLSRNATYEVNEIAFEGPNKAIVSIAVTNVDTLSTINAAGEYFSEHLDEFIGDLDYTADDYSDQVNQRLFDYIYDQIDENDQTVTSNVVLNLSKTGDEWSLDQNSTAILVNALMGESQN